MALAAFGLAPLALAGANVERARFDASQVIRLWGVTWPWDCAHPCTDDIPCRLLWR